MTRLRRQAAPIALGAALVLALLALTLVVGGTSRGRLDPDAYDPAGAHALAVLLADLDVRVQRTTDVPATLAAAGPDATVFVARPELLSTDELNALTTSGGQLVVAAPDAEQLAALGLPAEPSDQISGAEADPGCNVPWVQNAGRALAGGLRYRSADTGAESCYDGSILVLPAQRAVLLGNPDALANAELAHEGDAALGLGALGRTERLVWFIPAISRAPFGERPITSPDELLPEWVPGTRLYLLVVGGLMLVAWRGRRLGRVVVEALPVVVRASETVEGHGRLAHAAGARETAAQTLRQATVDRLERLAHGGRALPADEVVALVADRTGRSDTAVRALLYGPAPVDDTALVRLADDLDLLAREALTPTPHREATDA
jgi:hypothetical protein